MQTLYLSINQRFNNVLSSAKKGEKQNKVKIEIVFLPVLPFQTDILPFKIKRKDEEKESYP